MAARDGFALCARESNLNTVDLWTPSEICGANADYKQIPSNPSKGMTLIAIQRKKDAREGMYPSSGDTCEHGKSNDCNSRRPFSRWFYRELNDNTREDSVLDFLRDSVEYGWAVMIAVAYDGQMKESDTMPTMIRHINAKDMATATGGGKLTKERAYAAIGQETTCGSTKFGYGKGDKEDECPGVDLSTPPAWSKVLTTYNLKTGKGPSSLTKIIPLSDISVSECESNDLTASGKCDLAASGMCLNCVVGTYQDSDASNWDGYDPARECTVCGKGKYQDEEGKSGCKECPAAKPTTVSVKSTDVSACISDCDTTPVVCPAGKFSPPNPCKAAEDCHLCPPGHHCPGGAMTVLANADVIKACPAGTVNNVVGAADEIVGCQKSATPCPPGYVCGYGTNNATASDLAVYAAAMYDQQFKDSATVGGWGQQCECPSGVIYWAGDNKDSCKTGGACGGGIKVGTCDNKMPAEFEGMRVVCEIGSIIPVAVVDALKARGGAIASPTLCPAGSVCRGSVTGDAGTEKPSPCKKGYYCPAGTTGLPGDLDPGVQPAPPCTKGNYCPGANSTAPTPCTPGFYCPTDLMPAPIACPAGSSCLDPGTPTPTPCPAGFCCPAKTTTIQPCGACSAQSKAPVGAEAFAARMACPVGLKNVCVPKAEQCFLQGAGCDASGALTKWDTPAFEKCKELAGWQNPYDISTGGSGTAGAGNKLAQCATDSRCPTNDWSIRGGKWNDPAEIAFMVGELVKTAGEVETLHCLCRHCPATLMAVWPVANAMCKAVRVDPYPCRSCYPASKCGNAAAATVPVFCPAGSGAATPVAAGECVVVGSAGSGDIPAVPPFVNGINTISAPPEASSAPSSPPSAAPSPGITNAVPAPAPPAPSPVGPTTITTTTCNNVGVESGYVWANNYGRNCAVYASSNWCAKYGGGTVYTGCPYKTGFSSSCSCPGGGDGCSKTKINANAACCACGGGTKTTSTTSAGETKCVQGQATTSTGENCNGVCGNGVVCDNQGDGPCYCDPCSSCPGYGGRRQLTSSSSSSIRVVALSSSSPPSSSSSLSSPPPSTRVARARRRLASTTTDVARQYGTSKVPCGVTISPA